MCFLVVIVLVVAGSSAARRWYTGIAIDAWKATTTNNMRRCIRLSGLIAILFVRPCVGVNFVTIMYQTARASRSSSASRLESRRIFAPANICLD